MNRSASDTPASAKRRDRRLGSALPAFLIGLPLAGAILLVVNSGLLADTDAERYVSHPVECVEVAMFCCAVGALLAKMARYLSERAAFGKELLPAWNGQAVPASEATALLAHLDRQPSRWQGTLLGRRIAAVLDFVRSRGSATELDDQLRSLADTDAIALDTSYSLIRFITWAVPILGFLGTVLGITGAIAGVTPEKLESSLNDVTTGLALAFDATALALALTMVAMFLNFLVERCEQSVLERVDAFADRQLAHRFERTGQLGQEGGDLGTLLRQHTQTLARVSEQLVERQAAAWSRAQEEADRKRAGADAHLQATLTAAIEAALEKTMDAQARRLAGLEKQVAPLADKLGAVASSAQMVAGHTEALVRLQEGSTQLLHVQESLQQNLAALANAGAFEQAVHSLTAAIHMLTLHAGPGKLAPRPAPGGPASRPGAAA